MLMYFITGRVGSGKNTLLQRLYHLNLVQPVNPHVLYENEKLSESLTLLKETVNNVTYYLTKEQLQQSQSSLPFCCAVSPKAIMEFILKEDEDIEHKIIYVYTSPDVRRRRVAAGHVGFDYDITNAKEDSSFSKFEEYTKCDLIVDNSTDIIDIAFSNIVKYIRSPKNSPMTPNDYLRNYPGT